MQTTTNTEQIYRVCPYCLSNARRFVSLREARVDIMCREFCTNIMVGTYVC